MTGPDAVRGRVAVLALAVLVAAWPLAGGARQAAATDLPGRLSDRDFWQLSAGLSEPDGRFQSDNLVSNERVFQHVVPALAGMPRGGVYLGVAPEQNFTYIAALEPKIAFILDIRRGNLLLHLLYKSLFELSANRADFLSRLFSRRRPDRLGKDVPVHDLFDAFARAIPDEALHKANVLAVERQLTRRRGFPLTPDDLGRLRYLHGMFFHFGPDITYASSSGRGGRGMPSFAALQQATDAAGEPRSYLASHDAYMRVRALQQRNLIVPIVGDFAGPQALRGVGRYLAAHRATVTVFYTSNVEQYLFQNGVWAGFYDNLSQLPLDERSVIIRSPRGGSVIDAIRPLLNDVGDGKIRTYADITNRGRPR